MANLTIPNVPVKLIEEIRQWAALRRTTEDLAVIELLRIGLHAVRDQNWSNPPEDLDLTDEGRPPRRGVLHPLEKSHAGRTGCSLPKSAEGNEEHAPTGRCIFEACGERLQQSRERSLQRHHEQRDRGRIRKVHCGLRLDAPSAGSEVFGALVGIQPKADLGFSINTTAPHLVHTDTLTGRRFESLAVQHADLSVPTPNDCLVLKPR